MLQTTLCRYGLFLVVDLEAIFQIVVSAIEKRILQDLHWDFIGLRNYNTNHERKKRNKAAINENR